MVTFTAAIYRYELTHGGFTLYWSDASWQLLRIVLKCPFRCFADFQKWVVLLLLLLLFVLLLADILDISSLPDKWPADPFLHSVFVS